jgi:putative ATPase
METIVRRALADEEHGLGRERLAVDDDAIAAIASSCGGDARIALNAAELAVSAAMPGGDGVKRVTRAMIEEALQHRTYLYDKAGEAHYDTISAFIKSLRGSDADAALYWLARMIDAGEDPLYIIRRMVILAAEDVGLADPQALVVATACQQAVHFVGMPEGFLPMAECAIYLATAPKSNSALTAYHRALADARQTRNDAVPLHLRNAVTGLMRELGYGKDYKYAHSYPGHQVEQEHLPKQLRGRRYYEPGQLGWEQRIWEAYQRLRQRPEEDGP